MLTKFTLINFTFQIPMEELQMLTFTVHLKELEGTIRQNNNGEYF